MRTSAEDAASNAALKVGATASSWRLHFQPEASSWPAPMDHPLSRRRVLQRAPKSEQGWPSWIPMELVRHTVVAPGTGALHDNDDRYSPMRPGCRTDLVACGACSLDIVYPPPIWRDRFGHHRSYGRSLAAPIVRQTRLPIRNSSFTDSPQPRGGNGRVPVHPSRGSFHCTAFGHALGSAPGHAPLAITTSRVRGVRRKAAREVIGRNFCWSGSERSDYVPRSIGKKPLGNPLRRAHLYRYGNCTPQLSELFEADAAPAATRSGRII